MDTEIVNVVICYQNEDEVIDYVKQLYKQTSCEKVGLVIVVNKYGRHKEYLHTQIEKVGIPFEIFDPGKNLGYLNGLIYGVLSCEKSCQWYIFSNTDIELPDVEMIEKFQNSESFEEPNTWIVGPSVYAPANNIFSNPYMVHRPSKMSYMLRNIGMKFPELYESLFRIKSRLQREREIKPQMESQFVYAVHGSFFFVRKELIYELMKREEWELLYDEEQYLAEVALLFNKKVYFNSCLKVYHMEGTSTGKISVKNRYNRMKRSNKRLLKEFY